MELKSKLKETAAVVEALLLANVVTKGKLAKVSKDKEEAKQELEKQLTELKVKLKGSLAEKEEAKKAHELEINAMRAGFEEKNEELKLKVKAMFDLD